MLTVHTPHKAACHCRSVAFEVTLTDGLKTARRCTFDVPNAGRGRRFSGHRWNRLHQR